MECNIVTNEGMECYDKKSCWTKIEKESYFDSVITPELDKQDEVGGNLSGCKWIKSVVVKVSVAGR